MNLTCICHMIMNVTCGLLGQSLLYIQFILYQKDRCVKVANIVFRAILNKVKPMFAIWGMFQELVVDFESPNLLWTEARRDICLPAGPNCRVIGYSFVNGLSSPVQRGLTRLTKVGANRVSSGVRKWESESSACVGGLARGLITWFNV